MTQLKCLNTCYMPTAAKKHKKGEHQVVERFEDEDGGVYEVEENLVKAFIASGNFVVV